LQSKKEQKEKRRGNHLACLQESRSRSKKPKKREEAEKLRKSKPTEKNRNCIIAKPLVK